jgi:hypothetical protein
LLDTDEVVLVLVGHCGAESDFGRTALQKMAYLAGASLGWTELGHRPHYYGPYSRLIDRETSQLVRDELISEESQELGFIGTSGFMGRRYRYRLTDQGVRRVEVLTRALPEDVAALRDCADRIHLVVGNYDQRVLSLAAKTHFVVQQRGGNSVSPTEIEELARGLGWIVTEAQIASVTDKLEALDLIAVEPR